MKINSFGATGVHRIFLLFFFVSIISPAFAGESKRFAGKNYSLIFYDNGTVDVCAKGAKGDVPIGKVGQFVFPAGKIKTADKATISTELKPIAEEEKVHFENIFTADEVKKSGWPQVIVTYPLDSGSIVATWTLLPQLVQVRYRVNPSDAKQRVEGPAALSFKMFEKLDQVEKIKPSRWLKHSFGGVPYQRTAGMAYRYGKGEKSIIIANDHGVPELYDSAKNEISVFVRTVKRPWSNDHLEANLAFSFKKSPVAMPLAIAAAGEERLMLNIKSPKSFYLWDNVDEPIKLEGTVVNLADKAQRVDVDYTARDYDGNIIEQKTCSRFLKSLEQWEIPINLTVKEAGPIFLEVQAQHDRATSLEYLTVGVLPQWELKDKENSRFGIAAYRGGVYVGGHTELRTEKQLFELMRRLGVRWLRQANDHKMAQDMGFYTFYQNGPYGPVFRDYVKGNPTWMSTTKNRENWIRGNLQTAINHKAVCFEFGNEWNSHGGEQSGLLAERYVRDWMIPMKKLRDEMAPNLKLAGLVITGGDLVYMDKVNKAGGWDTFDWLAFHAGGPPRSPDFDDGKVYWSYLLTLSRVHQAMREFGKKDLWMTEMYAPTAPNSSCSPSERLAAEDIALMFGLAVAADVKGVMYYCLDDYILREEIKTSDEITEPVERECYFGLVRVDWTPKPSLWSYHTAAYYLDGAKFVGDIVTQDEDLNGLLFETNNGKVAMLWSRKEGYVRQEPTHPRLTRRAPWRNLWTIQTPLTLACESGVTVVDCVGRSKVVSPDKDGQITLQITGSPIYVLDGDFKTYDGPYSCMFK